MCEFVRVFVCVLRLAVLRCLSACVWCFCAVVLVSCVFRDQSVWVWVGVCVVVVSPLRPCLLPCLVPLVAGWVPSISLSSVFLVFCFFCFVLR